VTVDTEHPGPEIPDDFSGLSFETETLLPSGEGVRYFSNSNRALVETFRNLGVRSLRIGGNTADRPTLPFPETADIDSLFSFSRVAGVNILFTFRLREGGPEQSAALAKHMAEQFGSSLTCLAIGNEPDVYLKTYPAYKAELNAYMETFAASAAGRSARFCGPGTTPSKVQWARQFSNDFHGSNRVQFITQHAYPGNSGREVTDAAAGRAAMLSTQWVESYQKFYSAFNDTNDPEQLPYRLEETNSYFHGGAKDVSDTFAAALWGLDYMHWWAMHGAAGLNFHTGERVAAGDQTTPCYYAVFLPSGKAFAFQPLGYAMKAFDLAGHGRTVPTIVGSAGINITAYGVLSPDGALYVTLVNKEFGPEAPDVTVTVAGSKGYRRGEKMRLEVPGGDVSAKAGLRLGGDGIGENGFWRGKWKPLQRTRQHADVDVVVPYASAVILKLTEATGQ
jgi:hypothetical protein